MFDVGFWELAIIAVVALVVIGPERLPSVARTAGKWFGKISRFVTSVKADIDRELKADEMKRVMEKHASTAGMHEIIEETQADLKEIQEATAEAVDETNKAAEEVEGSSGNTDNHTHDFDDADDGDDTRK